MKCILFGFRQSEKDALWRPIIARTVRSEVVELFVGDGQPGHVGKATVRARAMDEMDRFYAEPNEYVPGFPAVDMKLVRNRKKDPLEDMNPYDVEKGVHPDFPEPPPDGTA